MSQIVIVSGPPAAGKTSVCRALCERYDRTVHLETDQLYGSIQMGYIEPWKPGSARQNHMVSRAAARAATAFAEDLFAVFIDGVIGPHLLPDYVEELGRTRVPVHLVVLLPTLDEILRRAEAREKLIPGADDVYARAHAWFSEAQAFAPFTIDSTGLSALETADRVMDMCGSGDCLVLRPD